MHAAKASTTAHEDVLTSEEELLITWWRQAQQHQEKSTLHDFTRWHKEPPLHFSSLGLGASEHPQQQVGHRLFQRILSNLIRIGEETKD